MTNWIKSVYNLLKPNRPQTAWLWDERRHAYLVWDAYYDNTIYAPIADGGQRDSINALLGNGAAADIAGLYNPVARVVDLYAHTLSGEFGVDVQVLGSNSAAIAALALIWKWTNMELFAQELTQITPLHGNCGIRIIARNHPDPAQRRVYLQAEHPRVVKDVDLDGRGNIQSILLEYEMQVGDLGEQRKTITIRELLTKEWFQTWRVEGMALTPYDVEAEQDNGPNSAYPNDLGVVPYVLAAQTRRGKPYSVNAFYQPLPAIDRYNALMTHINIQIHKHVNAVWMIAGSGPPPKRIDLSGMSVVHFNTAGTAGQTSHPPVMQPMVAALPIADATAQAREVLNNIEDALPELKATGGKFLAGQSGETIAQLRQPAEDKLKLARTNYEDALTRAQQIALSWMVLLELADLGTGMGTREAADQAYRNGAEDHRFARRPLLPDPAGSAPMTQPTPTPPVASAVAA